MNPLIFRLHSLIVLFSLIVAASTHSQDWELIKAFQPTQSLHSIRFANNAVGWTVSTLYNGSTNNIHKTEDGGESWIDQNSGHTGTRFKDIWVISEDTVFMCGNFGLVIHTFDGGDTWISDSVVPSGDHLFGIWFVGETGYVCGNSGAIFKTIDLGETWNPVNPPFITAIEEICFLDENFGFICGLNFIYYTEDGGDTWTEPETFPGATTNWWLREFSFVSPQVGYVCGDIGQVYKTNDAGKNWEFLPNTGTSESLQSIVALDEENLFACGFAGTVIQSEDGGETWFPMTAGSTQIFFSMDFTPDGTGFISTWSGEVLRYIPETTHIFPETPENAIHIFPNPATNRVFIDRQNAVKSTQYKELMIFDPSGKWMETLPITRSIDISEWTPGSYLLLFISKDGTIDSNRLIKQ
jgi:photosystem II stability/assembly factor-like uncharacterized protein